MAKIYSKNKEFTGISASINFVDGVGESNVPHLITWFAENGYTIVEDKTEPIDYPNISYNELKNIAKKKGFNGIGVKKEELIKTLLEMEG